MTWENRKGKGRYYTRSKKVNGRVVREYVGSGPRGEQAAAVDAQIREMHQAQIEALEREEAFYRGTAATMEEFRQIVELLRKAVLLNAGYRQHDRGEWRRKRDASEPSAN